MGFGDWAWNEDGDTFWALDELDRVVAGEALASRPRPNGEPEWDYLRDLPKRTLRRLRGAGCMRSGAMPPDLLADLIVSRVADCETIDDAMEWYVKTCLVAIDEARVLARRRRHLNVARRNGHSSYYQYRTALARQQGYASVWEMRKDRGWT